MDFYIMLGLIFLIFIINIKNIIHIGISDVFFESFSIIAIMLLSNNSEVSSNEYFAMNIITLISALICIEVLYSNKYLSIKKIFLGKKIKKVSTLDKFCLGILIGIILFALGALIYNSGMTYGIYLILIISLILYISIVKVFSYLFIIISN